MPLEKTTWGHISVGSVIQDANGHFWDVVDSSVENVEPGMSPWFKIQSSKGDDIATIPPRPANMEVTEYELTKGQSGGMINLIIDTLGAEVIEHTDSTTGATWFRKSSNMSAVELVNHMNAYHRHASSLTMELDKLRDLHAKLHEEGGHGAHHEHL